MTGPTGVPVSLEATLAEAVVIAARLNYLLACAVTDDPFNAAEKTADDEWNLAPPAVLAARLRRGWSKEEAARKAGVSSITWKRVEDGLPVQDAKLAAIAGVLDLAGSFVALRRVIADDELEIAETAAHFDALVKKGQRDRAERADHEIERVGLSDERVEGLDDDRRRVEPVQSEHGCVRREPVVLSASAQGLDRLDEDCTVHETSPSVGHHAGHTAAAADDPTVRHEREPDVWWELRVIREKDGHSLTSLANAAEMSLGYLSDLEGGRRWPNATVTKKLALALKVPVSVLAKPRDHEGSQR